MGYDYFLIIAGRLGHLDDETPPGIIGVLNFIDKNT